jgi:hypothetical protein
MASFSNTILFFIKDDHEPVMIDVAVGHGQPSVTQVHLEGERLKQFDNNVKNFEMGTGASLKGKKGRIHTSVQDKQANTDKIHVKHTVHTSYDSQNEEINKTAANEGDMFDMFTEILFI